MNSELLPKRDASATPGKIKDESRDGYEPSPVKVEESPNSKGLSSIQAIGPFGFMSEVGTPPPIQHGSTDSSKPSTFPAPKLSPLFDTEFTDSHGAWSDLAGQHDQREWSPNNATHELLIHDSGAPPTWIGKSVTKQLFGDTSQEFCNPYKFPTDKEIFEGGFGILDADESLEHMPPFMPNPSCGVVGPEQERINKVWYQHHQYDRPLSIMKLDGFNAVGPGGRMKVSLVNLSEDNCLFSGPIYYKEEASRNLGARPLTPKDPEKAKAFLKAEHEGYCTMRFTCPFQLFCHYAANRGDMELCKEVYETMCLLDPELKIYRKFPMLEEDKELFSEKRRGYLKWCYLVRTGQFIIEDKSIETENWRSKRPKIE